MRVTVVALALAACLIAAGRTHADPGPFFFRDGDRIVIVGDSITVQGCYVRYIENFIRTRYPTWRIVVRNAGINGHTAQMGLPYIDNDVLIWGPTAVVINWGMNDGRRRNGVEYYKTGIVPYLDRLLEKKLRVVLCSNSPIDIGDPPGTYTNFNKHFTEMAAFAKGLAGKRNTPFVDQFHFCHPLWGKNRERAKPVPVTDQTFSKRPNDYVHARAAGQLTMTYIILKTLNAPGEVSFASVDARSGRAETRRCEIREFKRLADGSSVSFVRADEASPCWIDDIGALAFELVPFQDELNRMTLRVTGLARGRYRLTVEKFEHGTYSAEQLGAGINLSENRKSPVCGPGREAAKRIAHRYYLARVARNVFFLKSPAWLKIPDLDKQKQAEFRRHLPGIDKQDAAIAEAAAPKPLRYTLTRIAD